MSGSSALPHGEATLAPWLLLNIPQSLCTSLFLECLLSGWFHAAGSFSLQVSAQMSPPRRGLPGLPHLNQSPIPSPCLTGRNGLNPLRSQGLRSSLLRPLPPPPPICFCIRSGILFGSITLSFLLFHLPPVSPFPSHQIRQLLPQGRDTGEGEEEIAHKSFLAFLLFQENLECSRRNQEAAGDLRHLGTVLESRWGGRTPSPGCRETSLG